MFRFLLAVAFLTVSQPAIASVPSLRGLGIEPASIAPLLGESQWVIIHNARPHTWTREGKPQTKNVRFISSAQVIDAPLEKVREVVTDVSKYPEFITELKRVTEKNEGNLRTATFETELSMMVTSLNVDYTLAFTDETNGDITWQLVEGDIGGHTGRWEFFALDAQRTLLVYTAWQDFESIGFTIRAFIRAQPDLRLIIPVASAAVIMNSIHRHLEGKPREEPVPKVIQQQAPNVPILSAGGSAIPVPELRRLAEAGTLIVIHPKQWFRAKGGKPVHLSLMSAAAMTTQPVEKAFALATSFERFPEFIGQLRRVAPVPATDGTRAFDYELRIGISIFTIPVDYRLEYASVAPNALRYRNTAGDFEHIHGAWEFLDLGDGKSLILYTNGSRLGDNAPTILKLGKGMPNSDLIIGVSGTAVTINKLLPWLEKQ